MYTTTLKASIRRHFGVNMQVISYVRRDKIRELCIKFNLYDQGTVRQYEDLLKRCGLDGSDEVEVAADIWEHTSESTKEELGEDFGIATLLFYVFKDCSTLTFEPIKENN